MDPASFNRTQSFFFFFYVVARPYLSLLNCPRIESLQYLPNFASGTYLSIIMQCSQSHSNCFVIPTWNSESDAPLVWRNSTKKALIRLFDKTSMTKPFEMIGNAESSIVSSFSLVYSTKIDSSKQDVDVFVNVFCCISRKMRDFSRTK